jgi:hypothetical protein
MIGYEDEVISLLRNVGKYSSLLSYNKTNRRTNFQIYSWYETLHISGSSSAHHQELSSSILILHVGYRQTGITCASAESTVDNS